MKKYMIITVTVFLVSAPMANIAFADRDATPEERARVVEALSAIGCTDVDEVELDGSTFETDVVCDDGEKYEIHLDQDMNVIKKIKD